MTVRISGPGCALGAACNPGHPARPVWTANANPEGYCWQCFASHRRIAFAGLPLPVYCNLCGDDITGPCEVQPVFGAERLTFCLSCVKGLRAARETQPIDALELLGKLPTRDHPYWPDGEAA